MLPTDIKSWADATQANLPTGQGGSAKCGCGFQQKQPSGLSSALHCGGHYAFRLKIEAHTESQRACFRHTVATGAAGIVPVPVCSEWRGVTKAKEVFGPDSFFEDEDPERPVSISCICDGIPCPRCKRNRIYRPISNQWDERGGFGHNPWFMGQAPCKMCRAET